MKSCRRPSIFSPLGSPPSRGAWIEIPIMEMDWIDQRVAPLAGGVD